MKMNMRTLAVFSVAAAMLFVSAESVFAITEQSVDPYGTFAGSGAGAVNTSSADYNAFFGYHAGYTNDTGDKNTFIGSHAGPVNESGSYNTFLGQYAGASNSSGSNNTFVGYNAGYDNGTTNNNTYIGSQAGYMNSAGSGNVFIGYRAGLNEYGSNKLYISNSSTSSPLIYGEFDNQLVEINGKLVVASDERLKKNIEPLKLSLDNVMRLKGVIFEWKDENRPGKGKNIGFIAQNVEAVIPELVYTDRKGYRSLSYDRFAPVLIGAIQEQQAMILRHKENLASESLKIDMRRKKLAAQDMMIKDIEAQLASLRAEVNKLKSKDLSAQK